MREPIVSRGPRGPEDRGKPSGSGNPLTRNELIQLQPSPGYLQVEDSHITLQSSKQGSVVQLTAPSDRENPRTGVKIKAKPLVLSFAAGSGFVRLDLKKEEDRRRWIYIVGSEQAAEDFQGLGLTHKPNIDDGDDPIDAHPRFGFGKYPGFWRTDEASKVAAQARRRSALDMIARDPKLEEFLKQTTPEELEALLAKRRAKIQAKAEAQPGQVIAEEPDEIEDRAEAEAEVEAEVEANPAPKPAPLKGKGKGKGKSSK